MTLELVNLVCIPIVKFITYIRLQKGWMYLVAVIDWYSRYVVSWELGQTLETAFVLKAARKALGQAKPDVFNSDQGSQFTSPEYIKLVGEAGVQVSMDGKGRATDNIFTEHFWRSLKYEEVYLNEYASPREARRGIGSYIDFYNHERPHQALGYMTPAEAYFGEEVAGRSDDRISRWLSAVIDRRSGGFPAYPRGPHQYQYSTAKEVHYSLETPENVS